VVDKNINSQTNGSTRLTKEQENYMKAHNYPILTLEDVKNIAKAREKRITQMTPEEREIYDEIAEMETTSFK